MRGPGLKLKNILLDIGSRLFVGVIFLIAGTAKLPTQPEWVETWLVGQLLPSSFVIPYISVLPWIEIVIGSCLVLGLFTRFFSLVSIPLIASFIVGNIMALSYEIPFERCGCFGDIIKINHQWSLVIDVLMLVGVVLIFFQRKRFVALDSWLIRLFRGNRNRFGQ